MQTIFVSSVGQAQGNDYVVNLVHPIKRVKRVELLYAQVPNSLYNLTVDGGASSISISTQSPAHSETYTIVPGFYSGAQLATEITSTIYSNSGVTCTYLAAEGKFVFTRSTDLVSITFNTTGIRTILGMPSGSITPSSSTRYGGLYVKSTVMANLTAADNIFLDIMELRNVVTEGARSPTQSQQLDGVTVPGVSARTFAIIPLDVPPGSTKTFKTASDYSFVVEFQYPVMTIDRLTVKWTDMFGATVNFNGMNNNSFMLKFYTI